MEENRRFRTVVSLSHHLWVSLYQNMNWFNKSRSPIKSKFTRNNSVIFYIVWSCYCLTCFLIYLIVTFFQAKFFMKTDDDIYLNIPMLIRFLRSAEPRSRVIHGCVKNGPQGSHQPISVSGASFTSVHPPFTAGAGYIISGDIIQVLGLTANNFIISKFLEGFQSFFLA